MFSRYTSPAARRAMRDEEGLTLIEIMIAGFVLSVAVLGLASVATASLASIRDSRERDRATAAASSALESVRALNYDEIALASGGAWISADEPLTAEIGGHYYLDHDGDGVIDATHRIWHTPGGLAPYICTSATTNCPFNPPADTRVTVRVFVTWHPDATSQAAKRITVVARWDDPAIRAPRIVRMSTVISPASRGMPAPAFEVVPDFLDHTYDRVSVETRYERCFSHTLNNFGARDSYDVVPGETSAGWLPTDPAGQGTWRWEGTVNGSTVRWGFRAFLVPDGVADTHPDALMRDTAADNFLDTAFVLDTGDSATVSFCYTPGDGIYAPSHEDHFVFEPRVRSKFDPQVFADVTHEIDVRWDTFPLYLHHHPRVTDGTFTRPIRGRASVTLSNGGVAASAAIFDQFPMHESPPPVMGQLPNYDAGLEYTTTGSTNGVSWEAETSFTPDGWALKPGTHLPPSAVRIGGLLDVTKPLTELLQINSITLDGIAQPGELFAAEWDYQFPSEVAPLTLGGTSTVRIWTSYDPAGGNPPSRSRTCLRAELIHNPEGAATVVATGTLNDEARPNWQDRTVLLTWNSDVTFETGDYLRLRLWADGSLVGLTGLLGGDNCVGLHIGYGAQVSAPQFMATLTSTPK